ncbi:MAG TPA: outer membrane beta-barrel protein [Bryobacteraceae bacterium]|nr:outer membrane beta-barrel protein [Bryobacteraceae bacterium]
MKRTLVLTTIIITASLAAMAQETAPVPVAEAGVNFSFIRQSPGSGVPAFTAPGGSATFVYNFNRIFSVVGDVGGYHNAGVNNFNPTTTEYLFGPRLSLRKSARYTPYVQALFGGAHVSSSLADANGNPVTGNSFAAAYGGGLDISISKHFAVKPFQLEYMTSQIPNVWASSTFQNNLRFSAGVVFRIGSK